MIFSKQVLNTSVLPAFLPRQERLWQNFEVPYLSDWDPKDLHLLEETRVRRNNKSKKLLQYLSRV